MPVCVDLRFIKPGGLDVFDGVGLLDTGNNYRNLISRELLEENNIAYLPVKLTAYSVDLKAVNIVGKVELSFKFQGAETEFKELFFVPEISSRIVNLGAKFMYRNRINLLLNENKIAFQGKTVPIKTSLNEEMINEVNKIPIISGELKQELLPENMELPGVKYGANESGELRAQKFNCKLMNRTEIYPGGTTISVTLPMADVNSSWYIAPSNSKQLNTNQIMIIEGIYRPRSDGTCLVNVINSSHKKITLLAGVKMGHGFEVQSIKDACNKKIIGEVNQKEMSVTNLLQKIRFIKEKLQLDDNEIIKERPEVKSKLIKIALDHFDIFSLNETDIGQCNLMKYDIELVEDAKPVKAKNIPLNPEYEARLKEQLDKWLQAGVVSEGLSEWNSPIFAVRKKPSKPGGEGKLRFVIDFRLLNNYTKKVSWPLPLISDNLNRLGKGRIFSTLDLTQAYHAMSLTEESKPYTAFTANGRQYTFNKLPFGLCNAPSMFCHLMDKVLSLLPGLYAYVISYLDDLIIFSESIDEHLKHILSLFKVLKQAGLKLNLEKCNFFTKECTYLGHIISADGLKMNPAYLDRIRDWSRPRTGKELQRFLGFSNYYRDYFQEYSKRSWPLDEHRNDAVIEWTDELDKIWKEFKEMFDQTISKGYPEWDNPQPFIIDIDYSSTYFAGVISQIQKKQERIIGICSKKCNVSERNYPSYKGELACLVYVLKQFLHFARFRPFIVRTDSISLVHYKKWNKNSINGVTYRWIIFIQSFDFQVIHRKGSLHINADCISRAKFDCKKHRMTDCEQCVDNNILDPYLTNSPVMDQIFEVHGEAEVQTNELWCTEIQKDDILNEIRLWTLERRILDHHEKAELSGRKELLYDLIEHFYVHEGILIFKQPLPNNKYVERPIVPIGLYNYIFDLSHKGYGSGHRGIHETTKKINEQYFMPGITKFVESRVLNCINCLKKIGQVPKHTTPITHTAHNTEVFGKVSIDLIGPLTPCIFEGQTVKYILIMVCLFSRYVFTTAIKDSSAECTIKAIVNKFIPLHGLFRGLRSDRGTNFTAKVFKGVMNELNVNAEVVPPRNPNSNPVERQNQSIYSALRVDDRFENKEWAKKLALATLVINCAKSSRTGYSPFFIAFGRQPILSLNLFSPVQTTASGDSGTEAASCRSYVNFVRNLEQIISNISKKSKLYLEFKNKTRKDKQPLFVNDICYAFFNLVRNDVSKKLQSFYAGPFIVIKKFSTSLYELQPIGHNPVKTNQVIGRDKIRKIVTKVNILGEIVPFNIHPVPQIVPSEEINISVTSNSEIQTDNENKQLDESFEANDFSFLSYEHDHSCPDEESEELSQQVIGEDKMQSMCNNSQHVIRADEIQNNQQKYQKNEIHEYQQTMDKNESHQNCTNEESYRQIEQRVTQPIGEGITKELNNQEEAPVFLSETLPSEQSFLSKFPEQSSPQQCVKVNKRSNIPAFLLKDRVTRKDGKKIHLQLEYKNPFRK